MDNEDVFWSKRLHLYLHLQGTDSTSLVTAGSTSNDH